MSRNPTNQKLAQFLSELDLQVADLASLGHASTRTVHLWSTGRKDCPRFEHLLAAQLSLSIAELRDAVGLPPLKPTNPRRKS